MKIKSFSCSADTANTIIFAARLAQLDKRAINLEYYERLCLSIGREFVISISKDPEAIAKMEEKTTAFIELQKNLIDTDSHEVQDH